MMHIILRHYINAYYKFVHGAVETLLDILYQTHLLPSAFFFFKYAIYELNIFLFKKI